MIGAPEARKLTEARLNRREANLIVAHLLNIPPPQLALHMDKQIDEEQLYTLIEQRLAGMPLQYVLGSTGFMGLDFTVGPGVLIPRPDTEIIVEKAISLLSGHPAPLIGDICTGSGAIAVSLAHYLPQAQIYATDTSPKALAYALGNAQANKVQNRCHFWPGDLGAPLATLGLSFDLLISNPPYISAIEMLQLPVDVKQEPEMALFGGIDGLDFYRRLAVEAKPLLKPGAFLLLEHGYKQQQKLAALMANTGWQITQKLNDYGNRPRALLLTREQ